MKTYFEDVGEFHEHFGLPITSTDRECKFPDEKILAYRLEFMMEELTEYMLAVRNNDLPGTVDAIADLVWVALGTAHHLGAPFEEVWTRVYEANMKKELIPLNGQAHPTRGLAEILRKPVGWEPPDVLGAILDHNAELL